MFEIDERHRINEKCETDIETDAEAEAENAEYWHKLCCLGELGWAWDGIYHLAPWNNEEGKRASFTDVDEAIKAQKERSKTWRS